MLTEKRLPPPPGDPPAAGTAAEQLLAAWEAAAPDIVRTAILLATRGDMGALKIVLDRVAPVVRGRALSLDLPELKTVADIPAINARLIQLVAKGEMTAEEASAMSNIMQNYVESTAATNANARIAALENRKNKTAR